MTAERTDRAGGASDDSDVARRAYLHIDLIESTAACIAHNDIGGYEVLRPRLEQMCDAVTETAGEVVKLLGDGLQAMFSEATDALRCAVAFHRSVPPTGGRCVLPARVALTYGICVRYELLGWTDYYASEIILAARLASYGRRSGIVMSEAFRRHPAIASVLDDAALESQRLLLRGFPEALTVYRLRDTRLDGLRAA